LDAVWALGTGVFRTGVLTGAATAALGDEADRAGILGAAALEDDGVGFLAMMNSPSKTDKMTARI
jgi:hypothetical protein